MFIFTCITILSLLIYLYVKKCHSYWATQKIPTLKPKFFVGNMYEALIGTQHFMESVTESYKKFTTYKYVGYYKCLTPALIVNDPELIGRILVQDFNHFEDSSIEVSADVDMLMGKNLFALKGETWRNLKLLITPMFTSGKLKLVYPLISDSCQKLVKHINKLIANGKNYAVNGKYLTNQYTTENVANCAFGTNANAFENEKSEFVEVTRAFITPTVIQSLKFNLIFMLPIFSKVISISFFPRHVQKYLINVVSQVLRYREENNIIRNDFLDMFSKLKEKCRDYKFDDSDVAAQAAAFFNDGIETSAMVLSYCLFEIATHPAVEAQLREEIASTMERHNGEINYESLIEMTYLDCVINETMRLNVPFMVLYKTCTKTYQFPSPKENLPGVTLRPGDTVLIPVEGLHKDERYYRDAEQFQPERFDKANKWNRHNYTYLPFGEGPRICVGMRFGVLQIKAALAYLVANFNVKVNRKTKLPLKLVPNTFIRMPVGGLWFDFEKIST